MAEPERVSEIVPAPVEQSQSERPKHSLFRRKARDADVMPGRMQQHLLPRAMSLCLMCIVVYGLYLAGRAGYFLAADAQVAPLVLSPDSDLVTASRLSLANLLGERDAASARVNVCETALQAARKSLTRLRELRDKIAAGEAFSSELTAQNLDTASREHEGLLAQQRVLQSLLVAQRTYVEDLRRQLEAGVVRRTDVEREESELRRLNLLELQNQREQLGAEARHREISMTDASLRAKGRARALAPEALRVQQELLHADLEMIKLEAEEHGQRAELEAARAQLARLERLIEQITSRPMYRALETQQLLAFVPYTQLPQVHADAEVYHCRLWAIFDCRRVGRVIEVLPGEVAAADPWGSPARGRYAVMQLTDARSAEAPVLRVRSATQRREREVPRSPERDASLAASRQ